MRHFKQNEKGATEAVAIVLVTAIFIPAAFFLHSIFIDNADSNLSQSERNNNVEAIYSTSCPTDDGWVPITAIDGFDTVFGLNPIIRITSSPRGGVVESDWNADFDFNGKITDAPISRLVVADFPSNPFRNILLRQNDTRYVLAFSHIWNCWNIRRLN